MKDHLDLYSVLQEVRKRQGYTEISHVELALGRVLKAAPKRKWNDNQTRWRNIAENYTNASWDYLQIWILYKINTYICFIIRCISMYIFFIWRKDGSSLLILVRENRYLRKHPFGICRWGKWPGIELDVRITKFKMLNPIWRSRWLWMHAKSMKIRESAWKLILEVFWDRCPWTRC